MAASAYKSPLTGFDNAAPLPQDQYNSDGKSLYNPPGPRSAAYDESPTFDFHIYYMQSDPAQAQYAKELHERVRREFPELRIYKFWDKPVGPHPVAMFEVNTFNPHQTGALFSWLVLNRGPCSVLVHPNTEDAYGDHTERATWLGRQWPLNVDLLRGH
ncbi:hypothetical protein PUNSTDRAFT_125733 [Punctularia strigosozonata HHB-11173 SS5]|uniref:uncharacterized protein n=1 Tax=Punctularia strigosozonata (strain HHB-11173) TaxID=741275 RepID=UPI000441818C|nr:uncharacterized protein PUNSTDRAFT_125733 [Punctularia strigosozonata HHB-11173 SS5]EIN09546.1 hypothetical protein PUNSTDRAFT_125733 [Punctularia strigosozonata HHB-11173 SS5]